METLSLVRWGILGCGDVAEKKGGPALYQAAGSSLVAVMRRDKAKAEDFARRHKAKQAYDDADALLADPDVDAVYIATPPHLHCAQTVAAARAGKHILVEKPMARSAAECDAMIAACRDAGVHLHVAYYRRFWPKFRMAQDLIRMDSIGEVTAAWLQMCAPPPEVGAGDVPWRLRPEISGGGLFVDVGSHRLDMLLFLLADAAGEVTEATGFADNRLKVSPAEDSVTFALRFASGAQATGAFHFTTHLRRDVLEIYGTRGTLVFDPFDAEEYTLLGGNDPGVYRQPTPAPTHLPLIEALVALYHGEPNPRLPPPVTGEEGRKTTRIMDAVLASR